VSYVIPPSDLELKDFKTSLYESQKIFNRGRDGETCLWVLDNKRFQQWRNSDHKDVLWISADPGCGKSVLCRALKDERLAADDSTGNSTGIYYFFFKDIKPQNDARTALCALLHQLFSDHASIYTNVALPFIKLHGKGLISDFESLWNLLLLASTDSAAQSVVIILDALDECKEEQREPLIEKLSNFYSLQCSVKQSPVKFLLTSRPYDNIERAFLSLTNQVPTIRLRGEDMSDIISQEINVVMNNKLNEISGFRSLTTDVQEALRSRLSENPNRTYLWLSLIWKELEVIISSNKETLLDAVDKLPRSVEDAYEGILAKCSAKNADMSRKIFQILIAAQRPLKVCDFDCLLAMNEHIKDIKSMRLEGVATRSAQLRQYCGLLVTIVKSPSEQPEVHWIHQTAKEFLLETSEHDQGEWKHSIKERDCHQLLGSICQYYLLLDCFRDFAPIWTGLGNLDDYRKGQDYGNGPDYSAFLCIQDLKDRVPLNYYASTHWHHHIRLAILDSASPLVEKSIMLCDISKDESATWAFVWMYDKGFISHFPEKELWGNLDHNDRRARPLYWATALRLEGVVKRLLEKGESPNQTGGDYVTPFVAALFGGNMKILQHMHQRLLDIHLQCQALVEVFYKRLGASDDVRLLVSTVLDRWKALFPEAVDNGGLNTIRQVLGDMIEQPESGDIPTPMVSHQLRDSIQHWLGLGV
jgi:hypothetical protein